MPKRVDREERRRALAEAVFAVIGTRGYEAVSLRDVAEEAGVSMGAVQHYFASKDEMLRFALEHMRSRVLGRLAEAAGEQAGRRDLIRAGVRAMLPVDEAGRQEACVNIAFVSAATVVPAYAELLRDGYERLLAVSRAQLRAAADAGELRDGVDADKEALSLYFLVQGLIAPLVIGLFGPEEAMGLVDHHLDRIFTGRTRECS